MGQNQATIRTAGSQVDEKKIVPETKLCMLGLENSGQTTIFNQILVKHLKQEPMDNTKSAMREVAFDVNGHPFRLIDLRMQKTSKKKWMHVFEDIAGVVMVVDASAFDTVLANSDPPVTVMQAAMNFYEEVINSKYLSTTSIVLLLNKKDVLDSKLKENAKLTATFADYSGDNEYKTASSFILDKFKALNKEPETQASQDPNLQINKSRKVYIRYVNALSENSVVQLFECAMDIVTNLPKA